MKSIIAMAPEGKGGVGKSLLMQVVATALQDDGRSRVGFLDSDTTNSNLASIFEGVRSADLRKVEASGTIKNAIKQIEDGKIDHLVFDVGARDEAGIINVLPFMALEAKRVKATIIAFRPLTLSSNVQTNATIFSVNVAPRYGVKTIFVRNVAQGRTVDDFAYWDKTEVRRNAIAAGVLEMDLEDAGTRWGDEAGGFGITLAEAALGKFERAGEFAAEAAKIFDEDIQAWLGIWLDRQCQVIREVIDRATSSS